MEQFRESTPDQGWTHVAFTVSNLAASVDFYKTYAELHVGLMRYGGEQPGTTTPVAWLTDARRQFVLVLMEANPSHTYLGGAAHLGVACASRDVVDERCLRAEMEGRLALSPQDLGPYAGYCGMIADPDGNHLELSYGQKVTSLLEQGMATLGRTPTEQRGKRARLRFSKQPAEKKKSAS